MHIQYRWLRPFVINWLLFASLAFLGIPAQAATFTVTNLTNSGPGSLRQAVLDASATFTANTIVFQAGLTGTITLTTGEIAITKRLTINGPGVSVLTISGNTASRIFSTSSIVTIKNLTLKNGSSDNGGAIYNSGNLTVSALTLSGNNANNGGGIYNYATMTATSLTLSSNSSAYYGGGIYNTGTLTATNLTLTGNTTGSGWGGASGGGISNTGSITITGNSMLSGNSATNAGGGIYNNGTLSVTGLVLSGNSAGNIGGGIYTDSAQTTTFNTCFLYNNTAPGGGGGVYNTGALLSISNSALLDNKTDAGAGGGINNQSGLTLVNSTIDTNAARTQGGGIFNHGTLTAINNTITENFVTLGDSGGIYNDGTVTLGNSIVAGNQANAGASVMSVGTCDAASDPPDTTCFTSKGANLFGENGADGITGFTILATDRVLAGSIDTAIAPLDENGGPTITHALVTGSPAINNGDNSLIPTGVTTDQRGPGFARIVGPKVDIGSVEYGAVATTYALTVNKAGNGLGTVTSNPAGISCGNFCGASTAQFAVNANVVLTAAATTGSAFSSWSGACTGTALTCSVAMTAAKAVTATFNPTAAASAPTATTNAASNVTSTSATLNGLVNSNGATATVSFDFGLTTTYGTSVAAASVYGNAAVTVNKPGLTCGQTYHYRVKAVNSKGTSYGENKTFTTVACTVTRRWPDFVITSVTLTPATPVANSNFSLAVTVKNQGLRGGDGGFLDVWANQAGVPTCGATGNKYADVGVLAAGASKTITITGLSAGTAGTKTARAFVDSWCEIVESNETNNQMIKAYTVQ